MPQRLCRGHASLETEVGPWEPTARDLHVARVQDPASRSTGSSCLPLARCPGSHGTLFPTVGWGAKVCAPEPRSPEQIPREARGRAVSPGLAAAACVGCQPRAHHRPVRFHTCVAGPGCGPRGLPPSLQHAASLAAATWDLAP